MLLPKKVGSFTLMRKLDADGLSESFVAILDDPAGKQVVARRILPVVARDSGRIAHLRARVGDLRAARHASLVQVVDLVEGDGDLYVLEDWSDGIELSAVIHYCITHRTTVPHNVYLNLATQVCNALEALHGRPGTESGSENVLHLSLAPGAMWVASDGRVSVGRYGLARSPTAIATAATGALPAGVEYLAPEQTHQDQKLTPASDIFSLGAILYELLTLKPMFRADSSLQTIHRVRRAEVTTQLLEVKEIMPGLDKVLFRALSLNPRHRYQRAFVLREDLRGLMAGYSFNDIDTVTRAFLAPIARARAEQGAGDDVVSAYGNSDQGGDTTGFLLGHGADVFSGLPSRVDSDTDATDALLVDPDSDVDGNTDRNTAYDPEEVDTAQNVHHDLRAAFNTDDNALRAPAIDRRTPALDAPSVSRRDFGRNEGNTDSGLDDTNSERTRWVSTAERVPEELPKRPPSPASTADTGWSRIPRDDDRVSVPTGAHLRPEPLENTSWKPPETFRGRPDADTGSHENTTNLLEPTTGPLPPGSELEPDGNTDPIDLGDPSSAAPSLAPRQPDDTRPAPPELDTRPHFQRSAGGPPTDPVTLEVNADTIDTAPVKGDTDRANDLARLRATTPSSAPRPSGVRTTPLPSQNLAAHTAPVSRPPDHPAGSPATGQLRPSSVTTWTDRSDAPRPPSPTIPPATMPPVGPPVSSTYASPAGPGSAGSQARTDVHEKVPGREPTQTLELDEPWADVPTSPSVGGETGGFRSVTYESIPPPDAPVSGLTGSFARNVPAGGRSDNRPSADPPPRQRFSADADRPATDLDDHDEAPARSFVPVAVFVLAGAVFLAVCAGVGGGGVLSWIATSRSGILSDGPTAELAPTEVEPVEVAAVAPPIDRAAVAGGTAPPLGVEPPPEPAVDPEQDRAEQDRAEQDRAEQAREEAARVELARVEQARVAEETRIEAERLRREAQARVAVPPPVPPKPTPKVAPPTPAPPRPAPVAAAVAPPRPAPPKPAPRVEAPPPLPPEETWDAVAAVENDALPSEFAVPTSELDRWSESAFEGELSPSAITRLEEVPRTDPGYTRARTLLYLDAKARSDEPARNEQLTAMMALPENRYNPILLVETAQIAIEKKQWQQALKASQTAEQHWARIPSNLVFTRKAMIYEIQALAHTGIFYGSETEDRDRLGSAIRGWERYRSHVQTKARADLVQRADEHLAQLTEIQRRLE